MRQQQQKIWDSQSDICRECDREEAGERASELERDGEK